MEHIGRYPQAVGKQLPLYRQDRIITRCQPLQHGIGPTFAAHWRVLRAASLWAIIVGSILAVLIALGPSNQHSATEITLRASGILIRCFHRLCVDGEQILNELIADWHAINASMD